MSSFLIWNDLRILDSAGEVLQQLTGTRWAHLKLDNLANMGRLAVDVIEADRTSRRLSKAGRITAAFLDAFQAGLAGKREEAVAAHSAWARLGHVAAGGDGVPENLVEWGVHHHRRLGGAADADSVAGQERLRRESVVVRALAGVDALPGRSVPPKQPRPEPGLGAAKLERQQHDENDGADSEPLH